jgi:RND family efflux transporter MFP subunit
MTADNNKPDLSSLRISREVSPETRQRRRWWPLVFIAVAVIAVVGTAIFIGSDREPPLETTTAVLTSPSQANSVLTANGYVVAQRKAAVASKGTGRLVYLGVEEGDRVKVGQIIARLEDADVVAALDKARADLAVAQADSVDATRSLSRERSLFDRSLVSQADLDAAQARSERVNASIISARAAVEAAAVAVENTRIRAPFDGTVLTKDADVGEVVAPFASSVNSRGAVVTMADMSSLQVEADVSESNITRVFAGQPTEIVLDAYPEKRYAGKVHKIVPTADRAKATVLTKVTFDSLDSHVLPEMSAKVLFLRKGEGEQIPAGPPKVTVPATAVIERDGMKIVFVVRERIAREVPVQVGENIGSLVVINQGISAGDVVVVHPPAGLSSGTKITPP